MQATRQRVTKIQDTGDTVVESRRESVAPVPDEHPQEAFHQKKTIFRAYQVLWWILGAVEFLLGFRFLLKMLGANPGSIFAMLIYGLSYPFAVPFLGLFGTTGSGRFAVEWTTLIAMLVYPLIVTGIVRLLQVIKPTTPEEVEKNVDTV